MPRCKRDGLRSERPRRRQRLEILDILQHELDGPSPSAMEHGQLLDILQHELDGPSPSELSEPDGSMAQMMRSVVHDDHEDNTDFEDTRGRVLSGPPTSPCLQLDESSAILLLRLHRLQAPACFIRLLYMVLRVCPVTQRLTHAEYFAGCKEVTGALQRAGHATASFELEDGTDESQNMLSDIGFVNAIRMSCSVVDGGAATSAPVCCSFVFMNSAVAKRCHSFPLGDTGVESVANANIMVARVLLLQWIFMARMIFMAVEQPCSSWMQLHDQFQAFLRFFPLWRQSVCMGDFGADTQKATWLYCDHACIARIDHFQSSMVAGSKTSLATTRVDDFGNKCVDGNANLKRSQAYTRQFGWALVQTYRMHQEHIQGIAHEVRDRTLRELRASPESICPEFTPCSWFRAARLDVVFKYMAHAGLE